MTLKTEKLSLPDNVTAMWFNRIEFRMIPGDDRYVSKCGKILSMRSVHPKLMALAPDADGYLKISRPEIKVHHAVLLAWRGKRINGAESRHLDGIKINNHISNLAWGTKKENGQDKRRHGSAKGIRNSAAKMTDRLVAELRSEYQHKSLTQLLKDHPKFSKFAIWAAVSGYTWGHLAGAIPKNRKCFKL